MAAVKWGVVRAVDDHSLAEYLREIATLTWLRNGHWPFMRVITVSKIDWIGMRQEFWVVSGIITFAGLIAFVCRGDDKYDIEFRGGTQVTFQLKDPWADLTQSLLSLAADADLVKAHPELKDLSDKLKNQRTLEERETEIKRVAGLLAADAAVVKAHPEVSSFDGAIKAAATQKTLSLDQVRKRIEDLHRLGPALAELASARVYSVGNVADRRYKMETTIANAPQNLEATLPEPLRTALGSAIKDVQIRHDPSATHVTLAPVPVGGQYLSEEDLRKALVGLAGKPGLKDLANAEVATTGKPEDHRVEVTIPNQGIRKTLLEPLAEEFKDVLETKPKLTIVNGNDDNVADLIDTKHIIVPISAQTLTLNDAFAKTEFSDLPDVGRDPLPLWGGHHARRHPSARQAEKLAGASRRFAEARNSATCLTATLPSIPSR